MNNSVPAEDFCVLFNGAPGLYLVLKPDLTIAAVNDAYVRATMTVRENIIGRGVFDVFPDNPDDPNADGERNLRASLNRVLQNRVPDAIAVQKYDIRRPESEGGGFEERYWSPLNAPILGDDGQLLYILHHVEDVTDFIRLQQQGAEQAKLTEELRTKSEYLASEIFLRAQEIQESNHQLREANAKIQQSNEELARLYEKTKELDRLKSQFFASVSHELRTPLNAILGFTGTLLMRLPGPLTAKQEKQLKIVEDSGRHLLSLINDLLDLARIESGKIRPIMETVMAKNSASDAINSLHHVAEKKGLKLIIEAPNDDIVFHTDRRALHQILINLLNNAIKFAPQGTVCVKLSRSGHNGTSEVNFAVIDTGPGISPENQKKLFDAFQRVGDTQSQIEGTGLGLYLSQKFADILGGKISLTSEPGHGSCFILTLPGV